jgi:hypothetical protein
MIYTVILNSNLRSSGTVGNAIYNFDWGIMEEGQYILTWGFCSGNLNASLGDTIFLSADLGQRNVFLCNPTATKAASTLIIGTLIQNETVTNSFFYGDKNVNGPILLQRPQSNQFNVKLLTVGTNPIEWVDSANQPMGNYILNLSFSKV